MPEKLNDFYIAEGIRQDKLIHDLATNLSTKTGFYMVVAAFVFSAEATLLQTADIHGFTAWKPTLIAAMILALSGILVLLKSSFLRSYRMPPLLSDMKQQWIDHVQSVGSMPEDEQVRKVKNSFIASLGRTLKFNDEANASIELTLEKASKLVRWSVIFVFLSVVLGILRVAVPLVLHAF